VAPALNTELFVVPDNDAYLVYAPLRRCLMRVAPERVNFLARLKDGQCQPGDAETDFYKSLAKAGIVDGPPESRPKTLVNRPFKPIGTTLLLTTRCNLACHYCYAGHEKSSLVMDEKLGRAVLDYTAENCRERAQKRMGVGFHSGGEPTMAWDQLVALASYAKELERKMTLQVSLGLATNACLSESKARWIAAHFSHVNVSLDGPPRIQNVLRPRKDGGPSWPMIRRTLRTFEACKTPYSLQATITRQTVGEMPAIVRFVAKHTRPRLLKFEPVAGTGRFSGRGEDLPAAADFARNFDGAAEIGRALGLPVTFSGLRIHQRPVSIFCGAFGDPFAVTPEGYVTACFEAFCGTVPLAGAFVFGRWDASSGTFAIDHKKLERLRQRHVFNLEPCSRCFCKYSCAGDCASRNASHFDDFSLFKVGARCEVIREVTRRSLSRMANAPRRNPVEFQEEEKPHEETACQ